MSIDTNERFIYPEGYEDNGQVILDATLVEKLQHFLEKLIALFKGGAGAANAASILQGIDLIKPAAKSSNDSLSSTPIDPVASFKTIVGQDPEADDDDDTGSGTPTPTEDGAYVWIPERSGNLWYATETQAQWRFDRLKREGVCTDDTCRIEQFKPHSRLYSVGYRVAIRDFADPTEEPKGVDEIEEPPIVTPKPKPKHSKKVEVHVNLALPQKAKVHFKDGREPLIFDISAGEITEELINEAYYYIYKRPSPEIKLGKWGLLYFCVFELNRGIGFHSNRANPRRKTLCDEGATDYCEPESELYERLEWGLVVDNTPRSHGCVRLNHEDSITFYNAVSNKTPVMVYKEAEWKVPAWEVTA